MNDLNQVVAITHKRVRGFVLRCLNFYPSDDLNILIVADFVRNCGCACTDSEIITHCKYLESKGYLEMKQVSDKRLGNYQVNTVRISSKGIDLLEANIPEDPGILV